MRLARLEIGGVLTYGVERNGRWLDLPRMLTTYGEIRGRNVEPPPTMLSAAMGGAALAERLAEAEEALAQHALLERFALPADARLLAPITRPNRILAIGRNYAEHARESGAEPFEEPIVFLKASTTVIGPDAPIEIPEGIGRVDYEGELLVVLGRGGKHVPEERAMSLVAGYTLFNDVTAREMQRADQARQHPWFRSKSLDTFGPMGPLLVTSDEVPDPHDLQLTLSVNGEVRQNASTSIMIHRIPRLISFLSGFFALEPGDVIATGTPSGIGSLVPGDVVEVSATGLGTLRNPVIAAPAP